MVDRHHIHDLQTPVFFSFNHTEYSTLCSLMPTFKAAFYHLLFLVVSTMDIPVQRVMVHKLAIRS